MGRHHLVSYPERWINPLSANVAWMLSTGKSGTTTLSNLLNISENVQSYHEPSPKLWHLGNFAHKSPQDPFWQVLLWGARRDVVSCVSPDIYAECNHRLWPMSYAVNSVFPYAKFIYVLRDMDSTVKSMVRWGMYGSADRNIEGRPMNPDYQDVRQQCAWLWCEANEFMLDFIEKVGVRRVLYIPFEAIKNHDTELLAKIYPFIGAKKPRKRLIREVLEQKHNESVNKAEFEKTWHGFDGRAKRITDRVRHIFGGQ